ncbi:MAG: hydantoinase/oxoprolinase family protein [Thermodesulfobacteriota bacterium]
MKYKIGIDVGGTFTDFLLTCEDGTSQIYKVLSTPDDPSVGLMNGLEEMAKDRKLSLKEFIKNVETIVHGTTVTTNAVLTYRGAKTGLLTTQGLRDTLEMRRGIREEQYNNRFINVEPLVPRYLRYPIKERVDYKGEIITPINLSDVEEGLRRFKEEGVEAIAVCFMNSFANSQHEEKTSRVIQEKMPECYLTISSTLLPSIRFYDRVSTTVLNSYVGPILRSYLTNLLRRLKAVGFQGVLLIMQSNGGVISPENAMERPVATLLSGPAGGPVAGIAYTSVQGFKDCITVDMGGTSFDAALIKNQTPLITTEGEINRFRLALPILNIVTIGAGGGSIGWIDEGGLLKMGPQSAGAKPGPACYDLGGTLPTCTDADLILGYLDENYFAGGRIRLNREKAVNAIKTHIADKLRMDVLEAAAGMYHVINVNMAAGIREVSIKKGEDPREFPLVVAGGAGPNHACMIALELEIPVIIIPRNSSIFCAAGMLMSNLQHDFVRTYVSPLEKINLKQLRQTFREMENQGFSLLKGEHVARSRIRFIYSMDMRYLKQYHEVNVLLTQEEIYNGMIEKMAQKFHSEHDRLYGYSLKEIGTPIEVINLRLTCIGQTEKPKWLKMRLSGLDPSFAFKKKRKVFLPKQNRFQNVAVFNGDRLRFGNQIEGPAIIEQIHTTTFISPEFSMICDAVGSFTLFLKSKEKEVKKRILSG